jgi:hypothetical protein
MGCCLLAATPILHQNTPDKKANRFVSSGKEQLQILTTQIQNERIGKQPAKNPVKLATGSSPSFLGKRGGKEDTGTNVVWPLPPPPGRRSYGSVCLSAGYYQSPGGLLTTYLAFPDTQGWCHVTFPPSVACFQSPVDAGGNAPPVTLRLF